RLLPGEDADVSAELEKQLVKRGVRVLTNVNLNAESCRVSPDGVEIQADADSGTIVLTAQRMLVSIGRQANVDGIGLEATDIGVKNGFIAVGPTMQTSEPHIYAIGDVIGGVQLAHAAAHEGLIAAEHIAGGKTDPAEGHRIPRCVYSHPEVASI